MATDRVKFLDTTLRDGEQSAGIGMTGTEKMEIAKLFQNRCVDLIVPNLISPAIFTVDPIHSLYQVGRPLIPLNLFGVQVGKQLAGQATVHRPLGQLDGDGIDPIERFPDR